MRVRFWGTRGSLPAPLNTAGVRAKVRAAVKRAQGRTFASDSVLDAFIDEELGITVGGTFGGNTLCVEVEGPQGRVICDLGSGLRELGNKMMAEAAGKALDVQVILSHMHWDHLQGLPFFVPLYIPGNRITIHTAHDVDVVRNALKVQHSAPWFPVDFSQLGAKIDIVSMDPAQAHEVNGLTVRLMKQRHPGDSYGFRFEHGGRSVVYATDSEHRLDRAAEAKPFIEFFRDADLVIFDAMYSTADAFGIRQDWGHSSNMVGVELAQQAGVKHLCLFHHDPNADDVRIAQLAEDGQRFATLGSSPVPLKVTASYDGLVIDLS